MSSDEPGDPDDPEAAGALLYRTALALLARREHTRLELAAKLARHGAGAGIIAAVLDRLQAEQLLSEQRFAEVYAATRFDRGYGPLRLRAELRERGVSEAIVSDILAGFDAQWTARLAALARRRFGPQPPKDARERAQRTAFLRGRGFTGEQIARLMRRDPRDD